MKIRSKIWLSIVISITVSGVLAFFVFRSVRGLGEDIARGRHYSDVIHKAYALDLLVATFSHQSDKRHMEQFAETRASLTKLLEGLTSIDVREDSLIRQIRKNNQELGSLLDQFLAQRPEQGSLESELKKMLTAQLWTKVRFISDDTSKLMRISESRIVHRYNKAGITVFFLLMALIAANVTVYLISGRSMARAQENLQQTHDRAAWLARFPEQNPNPIIRVSADGTVLYRNPATTKHHGWKCEVGQVLENELLPLVGRAMAEGTEAQHDIELDGRFYAVWIAPFSGEGYANLYGRDITERKRMEEAQRRSEARFKLLSKTAGRLLATDDPQQIVKELCRDVMKHLDCHTFFNFLVDESAGRLRLNACAGIPQEEARKIEWLDYGSAVCGCVALERTRIIAEDIFHVPDPRTDLIKSYGIQAYCCHPLMVLGRLIGTLSFGTRNRPNFTPEEVELMRTVTDQVAIAMQRIQTERALRQHARELQNLNETLEQRVEERTAEMANLSCQLVSAQENERKRVSYDLHDNVWQTLLAIRFNIESLFSGYEDWEALRRKSKEVTEDILGAVGKIRSMQGDLWPYVLDDIGLRATIDWYCREFGKDHSGLTIENYVSLGEREVPSSTKIVAYRILQEALSNVAKHSQAKHVKVRLMKKDHGMEFSVQDDGIGFDPEETIAKRAPWGGWGLLNIKARTELSGGSFGIESAKGKGTIVRASWPL